MENYVIIDEINQTRNSSILKCRNKKTKEIVVLKIISDKKVEEAPSKEILRELLVLMNFKHENIVGFNNVFIEKTNIVIEMEYCITSLNKMITGLSKPFYSGQLRKIIYSIANGLNYLHSNDIIHRDIKPGNILIDENCEVKIADFGSSRVCSGNERQLSPMIGTKWYKAPEIILGSKNYGKEVDIWSFGCVIAELLLFEPLFPGNTDFEMINMIFGFLGFNENEEKCLKPKLEFKHVVRNDNIFEETFDLADEILIDLMKKMLVLVPEERIKLSDVLNHDYLKGDNKYKCISLPV